jgi:small subunit ribosomal protein S16
LKNRRPEAGKCGECRAENAENPACVAGLGLGKVSRFTEEKMVKIRLRRTGCNNNASFRVVAADERSPRDGKFLEILGWYEPKREGENFKLNLERVAHWLSKGAQMSETVASMVKKAKKAAQAAAV